MNDEENIAVNFMVIILSLKVEVIYRNFSTYALIVKIPFNIDLMHGNHVVRKKIFHNFNVDLIIVKNT